MDIAVDLDGVVWEVMEVFLELYNKIYKENVKYEKWFEVVVILNQITKSDYKFNNLININN